VRHSLLEATDKALEQGGLLHEDVVCVSAGLAGVDYDQRGAREMEELLREINFTRAVINGDMVIAHAGALQGRPGVLALAGTGSVILGIGANGERVKVGGWGPIYGDEGSAYRIGQMALRAAARSYDGRGSHTPLVNALLHALKLDDFRETVERIYVERMEPRQIAALSRVAYKVAEAGDQTARAIFTQAGEELAEGVAAAIRKLSFDGTDLLVSYQGSILEACALVRERFCDSLKRNFPATTIIPPRYKPVIGAFIIGCQSVGWKPDCAALETLETRAGTEAPE
jgi:N-acetylglucosamine kinase-like BadF-type ATPase